ncbi:hypothetical protein [Catalinimonas alkaloidigena]|uniref:hypothetical protein n=1 Tax=Catalinimonas alkaloidigena TaxID=1075417 RepID=UPI000B7EF340|nr:hypothetical protein [Catalinimonas alkaloidigena]
MEKKLKRAVPMRKGEIQQSPPEMKSPSDYINIKYLARWFKASNLTNIILKLMQTEKNVFLFTIC